MKADKSYILSDLPSSHSHKERKGKKERRSKKNKFRHPGREKFNYVNTEEYSFFDKIEPTIQDSLLSQVHNGGKEWKSNKINPRNLQATSGQKWWMAVILGFLFFILASTSSFKISNKIFKSIYFPKSYSGGAATLFGLFVHMLIYILVIRIILW